MTQFLQGPCEAGSHLRLLGSGRGVPVCQRNPCIWEHLVQGSDGKCHELGKYSNESFLSSK
jgi:hypothetical protein